MRSTAGLGRIAGALVTVGIASATSSCGAREPLGETVEAGLVERARSVVVAPAETTAAAERIEAIRARFVRPASGDANAPSGTSVIDDGAVTRFEPAATAGGAGRVRAIVGELAKRGLAKQARVELPVRASDEVSLEDAATGLAIRFAPVGASDAKLELAAGGLALYRAAIGDALAGAAARADVVHRVHAEGTEDFVSFDTKPAREELAYRVDVSRVAGLRLVSDTLEFLDASGTPRLRVAPPYVIDAKGERHDAHLAIDGCAYDANPAAPWGRPTTAPGDDHCVVRVRWSGVAYPALVDPIWVTTGSMTAPRRGHTATLLPSGSVLITGGATSSSDGLASADLFDGVGAFAATGTMPVGRVYHAATLLANGKVLLVGGTSAVVTALASATLFDGVGTFTATGSMTAARSRPTATLLNSGKVLIAGGCSTGGLSVSGALSTAELFDGTGSFASTGAMKGVHCAHVAVPVASGKVLVAGGRGSGQVAELFDGVGTFAATGATVGQGRWLAAAVRLSSGKVLIAGGHLDTIPGSDGTQTTELFDGASFAAGPSMPVRPFDFGMTTLATGHVLVAGGLSYLGFLSAAEYYDGTSFNAIGSLATVRSGFTLTALPSGRALAAGGDTNGGALASAELLTQQGLAGDTCAVAGDCASGVCEDGICCAGACSGTCKTCTAGTGACVAVTSSDDPDTCTGANGCDATGVCKLKNGQSASTGSTCVSGFAADGVCCNSACGSACDACNNPGKVGTCSVLAGFAGTPACAPYLCQATAACPTTCANDAGCTPTAFCSGGLCVARKPSGGTCSTGAHECANGLCVDGFCCNTACTANCNACAAALSGVAGSDGTCTIVVNGARGRGECGAPSCSGPTTVSTNVCNGAGSCTAKSTSCGTFSCTGGACATACTSDATCGTGNYCAGTTCAPKVANGATCTGTSMCLSGNCVDGVCCNSACNGPCEACGETGKKGTCSAVTGTPRASHPACNGAGTSCGGTCDGVNTAVCSYPAVGTSCGSGCTGSALAICSSSGSCLAPAPCPGGFACASATACKTSCAVDGDCTSGSYCAGGTCAPQKPSGSACATDAQCTGAHCVSGVCCATACAAYACKADGSACKTSCTANADCTSGSYCAGSACVTAKTNGTACGAGPECASGNCADGVCCDRACNGSCEACIATKSGVAGSTGTCNFIVDGKDPDVECGTPSCVGTVLTGSVCNGGGVCRASQTDCKPSKCVVSGTSGTCANTCIVDADCGMTGFCKMGQCAPKVARGVTCGSNAECTDGNCVDGVCCNEACIGQCQACAEPGSVGTCAPVKFKPRGSRADCSGTGSSCYGQCDGTNIAACAYPTASQSCGAGCADGKAATCDGAGACLAAATCAGDFACDGATKCKTSCVADADCRAGFACGAGGKCLPRPDATCSADGTQSIPTGADAGAAQSCTPYRCLSTGACGDKCTTTDDCAASYTCDSTAKSCVPAPAPTTSSGGCSVTADPRGGTFGWLAAGALALALTARRRRR